MGWITNVKALSEFFSKTKTRRVDFMMVSDSNAIFNNFGQDHGITRSLSTKFPLYRTPLYSLNENLGQGAGQGYFCQTANNAGRVQTDPITIVPSYDTYIPYIGPGFISSLAPANYWHQVFGQSDIQNNGMSVFTGGPWNVNDAIKYSLTYGTFLSSAGVGKIRPVMRRGDAPFTTLADFGSNINPSAANQIGLVDVDLNIPAAVRNYQIDGRLIPGGVSVEGPFFASWQFMSWPNITKGLSYSTVGFYASVGLRTFILRESVASQYGWNEYFRQVKRAQGTSQPSCCFIISSGVNDRNDTAPSIGPVGGYASDTPEGFADNLRGLLDLLEYRWVTAGLNRDNLSFLMLGSHPVSLPDDVKLVAYREQAAIVATEYQNMAAVDMANFNTELQANAASWYNLAGADLNHLSPTGYEEFYDLVFSGLYNASVTEDLPDPKSLEFLAWKNNEYQSIRDYCSAARGITYYFSITGNNANDGLTPATAKQTIAEANTLITAGTGNQTFLFKRGDQWNTNVSLAVNKANIEIGDYGTGNLPWFNRFAQKYTAAGWTLAAGNRYTRAEVVDTSWVRFQSWDESKSTTVGKYLSRQTSAANCEATSNSFFWGANVLHVNLGGINPNTVNLEGNITSTTPGIVVTADKCYVHDIRVDGYGQDFANPHTPQSYQIQWAQGSNQIGYANNCETYYGGTHLHAQFQGSGSGAVTLIENCSAGFTMQGSVGETVFNTYSATGLQTTYFVNDTVVAGTLPNGTAAWVRRGIPFYGHTAGVEPIGLVITDNCVILSSLISSATLTYFENLPVATTLDQVRGFIIGEQANGAFFSSFPYKNIAWINGEYILTPPEMSGQSMFAAGLASQYFAGWMWNCLVDLNLAGQSTNTSRSYYNPLSTNNDCKLWHNNFIFRMAATIAFRFDFDTQSTDSSPNCEFFNNIYQSNTAAVTSVGLQNTSANLKNNAYFNIVGGADTTTRTAYGNDLGKVELAGIVVDGTAAYRQKLVQQGYVGIDLEYDSNQDPRPISDCGNIAPTIGPVELGYNALIGFTGKSQVSQRRVCSV